MPIRQCRISMYCFGFLFCYLFFYWPLIFITDFGDTPWLIPLITFVAIPIVDALVGTYRWNWTEQETQWIKQQVWMRWLPLISVPAFLSYQWIILAYFLQADDLLAKTGWLLTMGIAGGVMAINVGHELIHRKTRWERGAGGLLLVSVAYGSFKVEHIYGHHVWVATPKDMTTAPKGMTIYQFWWRALTKTPVKAWQLSQQLATKKDQPVHELALLSSMSVCFAVLFFFVAGFSGLLFWVIQSLLSILLLESVNYIEHYGLMRKQNDAGKFEPVRPIHSWNSAYLMSNFLLFNLQRHSDHHANASRTYTMLRHFDQAPQLPQSYAAMILLSLIPGFWFKTMNKRVEASSVSVTGVGHQ